jgi:hypothetical protein
MNAAYIEKLGYGRHFDELQADSMKAFLYDLDKFANKLSAYKQDGNSQLFKALQKQLKEI